MRRLTITTALVATLAWIPATSAQVPAVSDNPASLALTAPALHRLSPEDADAAVDAGAERNRAADVLAQARGDPALTLPGEQGDRHKIHGEVGVGISSDGGRDTYGEFGTALGDHAAATFGYEYSQFGRNRQRNW